MALTARQLVHIDEVAAQLHTTTKAVYRARARGQMPPAARINGRLTWRQKDIDAFFETLIDSDSLTLAHRRLTHLKNGGRP